MRAYLNEVKNWGGGILKVLNQKAVRREQFEVERNVFRLQSCVMERWREEKGAVRHYTSKLLTLIHDLLPSRCEI